jgi:ABC-type nitrate/sulfonate/bicarbonate transport system substrate-binding protein
MTTDKLTRRRFVGRGAAALGTATLGFTALSPWRARADQAPLIVGYAKSAIYHAPFVYLADNAAQHGLAIELVNFDRYSDMMLALQGNQLNLAGLGYVNIPPILDRDLSNIRIIAGVDNGPADLVIRKDVKLDGWHSYEGLKIAVSSNSMGEHFLRLDATEHGFDIGKVQLVNMLPGPAALIALKQGEIDGLVEWEPWGAQAVLSGIGYIPPFRLWQNSLGRINGVLGVSTLYAGANHEIVIRYLKAFSDACSYLMQNPEEHAKLVVRFTGIEPAVARKALETFSYDTRLNEKSAGLYAQMVHQFGLTKTDTSGRVGNVLDYSYLETVTGKSRRELGGA